MKTIALRECVYMWVAITYLFRASLKNEFQLRRINRIHSLLKKKKNITGAPGGSFG